MSASLGLVLESFVAILLMVAIGYCAVLDRRLQRIRLNEADMRKTVQDLGGATERAERAVENLRAAIDECDSALADRLRAAERQSQELASQVRAGGDVISRISRIVGAGRSAGARAS